ncbi:unnamed protein product, partial [Ectocarpus fasciculatus]
DHNLLVPTVLKSEPPVGVVEGSHATAPARSVPDHLPTLRNPPTKKRSAVQILIPTDRRDKRPDDQSQSSHHFCFRFLPRCTHKFLLMAFLSLTTGLCDLKQNQAGRMIIIIVMAMRKRKQTRRGCPSEIQQQ